MTSLETIWRAAFTTRDNRSITDWAHEHIKFGSDSPFPGLFDADNVPWTRRIYEAWQDPSVRQIIISGCPQLSGKTIAAQVCMAHTQVNDPSPMGFYADTNGKAERFEATRWRPMLDKCPALADRVRTATKGRTIFKDGSFLIILGAEAEANRQSDTLRHIVKDEAWRYGAGWGKQIDNRKEAFDRTGDWKTMALGTGGTKGTEFSNDHASGTCEEWHVPCPHCGGMHDYKWDHSDGGVFEKEDVMKADGSLDFRATGQTTHIKCPHCKQRIEYDREERARANLSGEWIATNEDADPSIVSITISAFVVGKDWRDIMERWIRIGKGHNVGQKQALKDFIRFVLAQFWEDRPIVVKQEMVTGDYTRADMLDGRMDGEFTRLAAIDYQHGLRGDREHFWFVVRAYRADGSSRLVDCGRVDEVADLDDRLIAAKVERVSNADHKSSRVTIDCAFKPDVIYEFCLRFNWVGVRGEDRDMRQNGGQYLHKIPVKKGVEFRVYKNFSDLKSGQIGVGRTSKYNGLYAPWRAINNQAIEDQLYELRSGKAMAWEVPSDIMDFCPEYGQHINTHAKLNVSKDESHENYRWTLVGSQEQNPDHLYACEKYLVGKAIEADLVTDISEKQESEQQDSE
jgi:phage terminase large subunit GpA-like protein